MVKRTDDTYDWRVFHVGLADSNNAGHYFLELNNSNDSIHTDKSLEFDEPKEEINCREN